MKVAIVCDWLTNVGGAEKVLLRLHQLYPEAPIYTSQYNPKGIDWFRDADVRTGPLQKYPAKLRRVLGAKRQKWFSQLDLSEYDLIISVTGAEAKAVKSGKWLHAHGLPSKNPEGIHICFCHVPTQYYWQMYDEYVKNPGFGVMNPVVRAAFKKMVKKLKKEDYEAAQGPEYFVTISDYAKGLIAKYYKREAVVIHPPVEVDAFRVLMGPDDMFRSRPRPSGPSPRADGAKSRAAALRNAVSLKHDRHPSTPYYITTSRQVNWKRIDLAVEACVKLGRKLLVVGEGPEHKKLVKLAQGSDVVEFVPLVDKARLVELLAGAKGYLFPSLEPFGIAPVEALAAGCPVIAYGEGGALDYVHDGKNGVLFEKQTVKSLTEAIMRFEEMEFNSDVVAKSAREFDEKRFDKEIRKFVNEKKLK